LNDLLRSEKGITKHQDKKTDLWHREQGRRRASGPFPEGCRLTRSVQRNSLSMNQEKKKGSRGKNLIAAKDGTLFTRAALPGSTRKKTTVLGISQAPTAMKTDFSMGEEPENTDHPKEKKKEVSGKGLVGRGREISASRRGKIIPQFAEKNHE